MRGFLVNKFDRILQKKAIIILALIIIPVMIVFAISVSGQSAANELIGYLGNDTDDLPECAQFTVVSISEMPKLSQLVEGTYAAVVSKVVGGNYDITTLKSDADVEAIETLFVTGQLPADYKGDDAKREERGIGTNILGFITMILIIQGVALTTLYPEDRSTGIFRRIMSVKSQLRAYLCAQLLFTFVSLYVPTYIAIVVAKFCLGAAIGYSLGMLAMLLLIIALFATAFAIFISTILDRNINLVTSGISIITCILSGCFLAITSDNKILTWIIDVMPQKAYMDLVHGIEFGGSFTDYRGQLVYLLVLSLIFMITAVSIIKTRTEKGVY